MTTNIISRDELTAALRVMRLWARHGPYENAAWRMLVLHPEEAADDILTAAEEWRTRQAREEWRVDETEQAMQQPLFEGPLRRFA
jgi:hypothetical protein